MTELGKIEKPEIEGFVLKRKIYCVPNIYPLKEAGDEYKALVDKYWDDVTNHLEKLESVGKIVKIFFETIYVGGKEAFEVLAKINERALKIVKDKVEKGAVLLPIESKEIFGPFLDWRNCLHIVTTAEVYTKILGFYTEILNKRLQHILSVIESNLSLGEAGLLIMGDDDRAKLQFPSDIEVFLVTPPSYDDISRWVRERLKNMSQSE